MVTTEDYKDSLDLAGFEKRRGLTHQIPSHSTI